MVLATILMHTTDLDQATSVYKKCHVLLCSKLDSKLVNQTFEEVINHIQESIPDDNDIPNEIESDDEVENDQASETSDSTSHESASSIKDRSPFTRHFAEALDDLNEKYGSNTGKGKPNNFHCPAAFKVITDVVHIYPMWAAALHDNVTRFANDCTNEVSASVDVPKCRSNAVIESHFKSVKQGSKISRKLRPRMFVMERLQAVLAKLNMEKIKFPETGKRRVTKAHEDLSSFPEVWNKRRKRSKSYGNKQVSLKVLGKSRRNAKPKQVKILHAIINW